MKKLFLVGFLMMLFFGANAQLGFGLRAGINMSKLDYPIEESSAGKALHKNQFVTGGVHVGLLLKYNITGSFSIASEILYSQKGSRRTFEGDGVYILNSKAVSPLVIHGQKKSFITINNSYIEIPLTVQYKLGPVGIGGGIYTGVLIRSKGTGEINMTGTNPVSDRFLVLLKHDYYKDGTVTKADYDQVAKNKVNISGVSSDFPKEQTGYFDYENKNGSLFSSFDFGLIGNLYYYFNNNFFAGVRLNYGLSNLMKNGYLISDKSAEGTKYKLLDGTVKNYNYQFTIGFTF